VQNIEPSSFGWRTQLVDYFYIIIIIIIFNFFDLDLLGLTLQLTILNGNKKKMQNMSPINSAGTQTGHVEPYQGTTWCCYKRDHASCVLYYLLLLSSMGEENAILSGCLPKRWVSAIVLGLTFDTVMTQGTATKSFSVIPQKSVSVCTD
jgi:hypothetical protein